MRARVSDTELYFDVDGPGLVPEDDRMAERPMLFLLHGGRAAITPSSNPRTPRCGMWPSWCTHDMRGCGRSALVDPRLHPLDKHRRPRRPRDYLGLGRISLLSGSYGGMVVLGLSPWATPSGWPTWSWFATALSYPSSEERARSCTSVGPECRFRSRRRLRGNLREPGAAARVLPGHGPAHSRISAPRSRARWGRGSGPTRP